MKILNILNESEDKEKNFFLKVIKVLLNLGVDSDYETIISSLKNNLHIENDEIIWRISYLYHTLISEYRVSDIEDLVDISDETIEHIMDSFSLEDYDDETIALSSFLDVPPFMLDEQQYRHYGLRNFKNLTNGDEFAIGDDDEAEIAQRSYYEQVIRYEPEIYGVDFLKDYIKIDDYTIQEEARYMAESRIQDMSGDEILDFVGVDKDEYDSKIETLEDERSEIEFDINSLSEEIDSIDDSYSESDIEELRERLNYLQDRDESIQSEIERLESERDNLSDEYRDEAMDILESEYRDEIEREGVDYFIDQGNDIARLIEMFGFDEDEAIEDLIRDSDRGNTLSGYDGEEHEYYYNEQYYYIYQTI
jgi:hypothetical protein